MNKQNLNVVIFDDDEESIKQEEIRKYTGTNRNGRLSSLKGGHDYEKEFQKVSQNDEDKLKMITRQMSQLQQKIKVMEKQGQRLKLQVQKRTNNGIIPAAGTKTTKQIQQILMIVQKKIQVIIQQSKKLVNKVTQTVERRLSELQIDQKVTNSDQMNKIQVNNAQVSTNNNEKIKNKLNQIQLATKQRLEQYEMFYKNQYEKLTKQAKRKEQTMMKRLSEMQLKLTNKINTFQTKEKQYVDWIHHLEAKLKERKSKKMITITQEKPQITPIAIKNSGENLSHHSQTQKTIPENNLSSANFQSSRANMSISEQNNNSKVIRKHRIFGGTADNVNKSVSPIQKNDNKQSPTKDSFTVPQKGPINPTNKSSSGSPFYQQPSIMNNNGNMNFYNELKRTQASRQSQQQSQRQQQQTQYKFADLNEFSEEYNESQSDDFFAPIQHDTNENYERVLANIPLDSRSRTYYKETINYGYENYHYEANNSQGNSNNNGVEKVFSPFDIN